MTDMGKPSFFGKMKIFFHMIFTKIKIFFRIVFTNIKLFFHMIGKWFIKMFTHEKHNKWFIPVVAIVAGLIISMLIMLIVGSNPFMALIDMFRGIGIIPKQMGYSELALKEMLRCFLQLLGLTAPMLFAALAVAVALKAGLFNIGVSGQMLVSGFLATMVGYVAMPSVIHKILVIIVGIVAGAGYAALVCFLNHKFNINEVVSTIMLNYIGMFLVTFFISSFFLDPITRSSNQILNSARLSITGIDLDGMLITIPLAIVLAIGAVFLVKFLLDKTKLGFEIKAVGLSKKGAKYAGINVGKNIILAMAISGALSGLAGVSYFLGYNNSMNINLVPTMGFDAIAVALLGASNPIGCIFAALFISAINYGSSYMIIQNNNLPQEIAGIMIAIMLLFVACGQFIKHMANRARVKMEENGETFIKKENAKRGKHKKDGDPPPANNDNGEQMQQTGDKQSEEAVLCK